MKSTETILHAKVNKAAMRKSERVFTKLGLTTDIAINLFLTRVCASKGIPFPLRLEDNSDILASAEYRSKVLESFYES
jgi:addiction module RelB/DinJ family antitoxin